MALPNPIIVVHAITAAHLRDEYPISPESVWSLLRFDYERSALHPDDLAFPPDRPGRGRYEAQEPARVAADQQYETLYRELIEELRFNLTDKPTKPVPVFPFIYDWRQPLAVIEAALDAFVEEVIERTALLRHYHKAGYGEAGKVNLLGHSMGGLVIAGYLATYGTKKRVAKVVTMGTPFRGSCEAIIKITTGEANMGTSAPSSREREAARATPALYHLLPDAPGVLSIPPQLPQSIFSDDVWQASILETIADFIRRRGRDPQKPREQAAALFRNLLETGAVHRARISALKLDTAQTPEARKIGVTPADWLCLVGIDAKTRVRTTIILANNKPEFRFNEKTDFFDPDRPLDGNGPDDNGDGTVPLACAIPTFLKRENVVCLSPDDFLFHEIGDRIVAKAGKLHGALPTMDMIQRLCVRFFANRADPRKSTRGRPAPGVPAESWEPPMKLDMPD